MRILVSNDDGYSAPGLEALVKALQGLGELTVVAPETNHSGASNSLTLNRPLSVRTASNGFIAVNGTPSDCVHVALTGLMDARPDLVVSGINMAPTWATTPPLFGHRRRRQRRLSVRHPAIAFSLAEKGWEHIESRGPRRLPGMVERHLVQPLAPPVLLNVNIPNRRFGGSAWLPGDPPGQAPSVPARGAHHHALWRHGLLDRSGRLGGRRGAGHGFPCRGAGPGLGHAAAAGPDAAQPADEIRGWAEPLCASA